MRIPRLAALALLLAAVCGSHAGEKAPRLVLTVHAEADSRDGKFARPIELHYAQRSAYISVGPDITDRDVIDVIPFAAKDGTQGAYLRLGPSGRLALTAVSQSKLGKAMVIFVNGRQIADLHIDRRIEDGILPIPSGLTALEIAELQKRAEANRKKP